MQVISLYDYTGIALMPWRDAGYECYAYDIAHEDTQKDGINFLHADLHQQSTLDEIAEFHDGRAAFLSCFPVCTDLAVSGAAWFAKKRKKNPSFQDEAAGHAMACAAVGEYLGCPYFVENPVSVLSTLWRKPNYSFHPFEYGGYLPEDDQHPKWPEYIAPRDAYSKKTCLWTNDKFTMPAKKPVECESFGNSSQHAKLGGKSAKTKNIRSATPRGFARAVFEANNY
jgi:hypothetical protein